MSNEILTQLAVAGAFFGVGLAAIGSALGAGIAGMAAIGAWKRRYAGNKPAPFLLMILAGAPLSQTIYAFVLLSSVQSSLLVEGAKPILCALIGVAAGLGFLWSAWYQGKCGAAAADAYGETDKGFANYLTVLGVVETVALFVLVFGMLAI